MLMRWLFPNGATIHQLLARETSDTLYSAPAADPIHQPYSNRLVASTHAERVGHQYGLRYCGRGMKNGRKESI